VRGSGNCEGLQEFCVMASIDSKEAFELLDERRNVENQLAHLENQVRMDCVEPSAEMKPWKKFGAEMANRLILSQISALEDSYLEDTRSYGNLVTGWHGYLAGRSFQPGNRKVTTAGRRLAKEQEKIFSWSSCTSPISINSAAEQAEEIKVDSVARGAVSKAEKPAVGRKNSDSEPFKKKRKMQGSDDEAADGE
jgi:hypothetical protein